MVLIFSIILYVVGLWIYRTHEKYLLHYILLWLCFGPIVINFFYTITDEYYNVLTWTIYLSYTIAFIDLFRTSIDKWIKIVLLSVILLVIYYVGLSFIRGTSSISSLRYITGYVGFSFSLCMIIRKKCAAASLLKLIRLIVCVEIFLAFFQPYTDWLNFHAALHGDDVMTSMVNGTFVRNNIFIEFLTPLVMILLYFDYQKRKRISLNGLFIGLMALWLTYNSGVRTALVAVIPFILFAVFILLKKKYTKRSSILLIMTCYGVILYTGYVIVQQIAQETGVTYTKKAEDSSQRQAVLLSMLNDDDFAENQTTLGLSFVVLSTFPENPIIGPGKLHQGKGYGDYISREAGNETDATLAVFLCEVGLIGLFVWFWIYYVILMKIGKGCLLPKLIFFYLLIVTIADPGLFFIGNTFLLFISIKLNSIEKDKVLAFK